MDIYVYIISHSYIYSRDGHSSIHEPNRNEPNRTELIGSVRSFSKKNLCFDSVVLTQIDEFRSLLRYVKQEK
jgi:hypothetical protein